MHVLRHYENDRGLAKRDFDSKNQFNVPKKNSAGALSPDHKTCSCFLIEVKWSSMALASTLFRFKIELSDMEKGNYQTLDLRVAQHPSETMAYLFTRIFAYALSFEEGIEFSPEGLNNPDGPTIRTMNHARGSSNDIKLWIEIGNPSERKMHKASKASEKLRIYTYKDPEVLMNEISKHDIFKKNEIEVFAIDPHFLSRLDLIVKKENRWTLIFNDGILLLNGDHFSEETEIKRIQ